MVQVAPLRTIRLRLLGRADLSGLEDAATTAILARPKLLGLLSYLGAATPRGLHRRDTLVGLFWGERDQERARGALRQSLYHLRHFLGSCAVATRGDEEVGLAADYVSCDVAYFEEALARGAREEALELYRGDLLEGLHLPGAPMFERWLDQRREELQRHAREAAWELAQCASAAGNVAEAAHWARRALQLAAQDEAVLRQVITLLDDVGDRAGAVREYEVFARRLREDLNLDPTPETRALVDDIRRRDARTAQASPASAEDEPVPPRTSVAVLPFVNMSADPENEYLSDGCAEEITNALSKVKALQVASRTSAFAFKGRTMDVRRIGQALRVAAVLEGSLRRVGNRLRVTAQLVKTTNGYHLWSARFDRETEDIFAIQDEIARSIARALQVLLTADEEQAIARVPTARVEAYEYYLRGRYFLHRFRKRSVRHAREMFERAIAIDPAYALAYAGVANCSSYLYLYFEGNPSNLARADEASRRVLELAPDLAEGHAARGLAVELHGRCDEADAEFEQAMALDPASFEAHYLYARVCFGRGDFERALGLFGRACDIREDYQARELAALACAALGREEEARARQEKALEAIGEHLTIHPGDVRALTFGAVCLARLGRADEALDWSRRALTIDPDDPIVIYSVACTDAVLGRRDEALDGLERAIGRGCGATAFAWNDPDLVSLRDDPRFRRLVKPN